MKKWIAIVLVLAAVLPMAFLASCADPLQDKIDSITEVYNKLGNSLYQVTEAVYYCGEMTNNASVKTQIKSWQKQIKAAKNIYASIEQYQEEELDVYLEEWNQLLVDMDAMYEKYKGSLLAAKDEYKAFGN